jgi:hypothetical protein
LAKISILEEAKSKEEDLGAKLLETSTKLVDESQRSVKIQATMETQKSKLAALKAESDQFRTLLFSGINGGVADTTNYANVSLSSLLRLRLQEADNAVEEARRNAKDSIALKEKEAMAPTMSETLPRGGEGVKGAGGDDTGVTGESSEIQGVQKLEAEVAAVLGKNKALQGKYDQVAARLQSALSKIDTLTAIANKNSLLVERSRTQKELRAQSDMALKLSDKKVSALSDHIEKLMLHLKHEATSKAKAFSSATRANAEVELLRARNAAIMKKNAGRERVIVELKEGAKILEDQLRLMDEKYMELRTKLDWTRLQSERTVKKKEEEARSLRSKFALMQGSFGGGTLLDNIEIDEDGQLVQPESSPGKKSKKQGSSMKRSASHA